MSIASGFRVLKLIGDFALLVARIHRADDKTNRGSSDESDSILRAVGHEETNTIAFFHTHVVEAVGDTIDHRKHFTIGKK